MLIHTTVTFGIDPVENNITLTVALSYGLAGMDRPLRFRYANSDLDGGLSHHPDESTAFGPERIGSQEAKATFMLRNRYVGG